MVVSTQLKNISQNGNLSQVGVKIKNIWNQDLDSVMIFWGKPSNQPSDQVEEKRAKQSSNKPNMLNLWFNPSVLVSGKIIHTYIFIYIYR